MRARHPQVARYCAGDVAGEHGGRSGIFDRWATGDFVAGLTSLDPDVAFVVRHPFPEAVETVGSQGIREYMRGFLDNWVNYVVEARTFQAAGDIVVAEAVQRGEGKASGIEMEQQFSCCSPSGRKDRADRVHPGKRPSPRSRRALGVGDVAGERGDRAQGLRGV